MCDSSSRWKVKLYILHLKLREEFQAGECNFQPGGEPAAPGRGFFLIWFCETRRQKIARGYSDAGELQTAPCREGERALRNKNTSQPQQAAVPVTISTFGHLSSPPQPRPRWDLGAEPSGACVDRTNPSSLLGKAAASQEGGVWLGDPPPAQKGCGCTSSVLLS